VFRRVQGLWRRYAPRFSNLRVRSKLIVIHNLFFLVLASAFYVFVIPLVEDGLAGVRLREATALAERFLIADEALPNGSLQEEDRRRGVAEDLNIPFSTRRWLDRRPGELFYQDGFPGHIYLFDPDRGEYASLLVPTDFYEDVVDRVRRALFVALGSIYVLAVLALEVWVIPRYLFRPIRATLESDAAVQSGERDRELISESEIPGDEIGDIMRSRNATVVNLREKEANLERALTQLETARRSMAAQDRLATIGLLSASVAHELNTPLSVLHGSIEQALERDAAPQERARLERMKRMTERLSRISESLLDYSKVRHNEERKPVRLRELIDEAWSLLALDERAGGVRFVNQVEPESRVLGDYDRLMQVFINLLRNGMSAVEGHGAITVKSSTAGDHGERWVSVDVDDDGPGIPEDVLPNIFDAFVSARLDSRGTGLGLTVAEGIVHRHGGRVTASNRSEGGARLEVSLPAA